jgi:hypothetical protein
MDDLRDALLACVEEIKGLRLDLKAQSSLRKDLPALIQDVVAEYLGSESE